MTDLVEKVRAVEVCAECRGVAVGDEEKALGMAWLDGCDTCLRRVIRAVLEEAATFVDRNGYDIWNDQLDSAIAMMCIATKIRALLPEEGK